MKNQINITKDMYTDRGFEAIPDSKFQLLITRAGLFIQEQTLGRLEWSFAPIVYPDPMDALLERNIRGICDLAELFFRNEAAIGENGAAIISFSNEGYREVYEGGARAGSMDSFTSRLSNILVSYFSTEQLSRRMYG